MSFPPEEIEKLRQHCDSVSSATEGGAAYLLLHGLRLPPGCAPAIVDALLCPTDRDGYASRLFFASQVAGKAAMNWNAQGTRILERNWFAYSWKTRAGLALGEMLADHLAPLR